MSETATVASELDWASMTGDEVRSTIAAMEREHRRAPAHEACRAKEEAAAEARLIEALNSHMREWGEAFGHESMEERSRRQRG